MTGTNPLSSIPASNQVRILGVNVSRLGFDDALGACFGNPTGYVCFANVHTVTESQSDADLRKALNGAHFAFADGLPLVWVSQAKKLPIASRVCGPDFMIAFLAAHPKLSYGLLGGAPGQAEKIAERFQISPVIYCTPVRSFSLERAHEDWQKFLDRCPERKAPKVVWIGLGAPKQELWMNAVSPLAPDTLFLGVGAAFDFLTGTKKRAPVWLQKNGLEWAYRLCQEPRRLWRRYLIYNSKFVSSVAREFLVGSRRKGSQ